MCLISSVLSLNLSLLTTAFLALIICVCVFVHKSKGACKVLKKALDSLEVELQGVVSRGEVVPHCGFKLHSQGC